MKCVINGDYFTFNQAVSIQAILQELELDADRVIVQHNENLVKQADFQAVKIRICRRRIKCLKLVTLN